MQTAKPIKNLPIAIVGMNAHFGDYSSLNAFEHSIYEGHCPDFDDLKLSTRETREKYDRVATIALKDAAINSDINIAIIVAQDKQQPSSSVTVVDSVVDALLRAQELLAQGKVKAVLVGGVDFGSQAVGAVVLKLYETAKSDRNRIYAVINALSSSTSIEAPVTYLELIDDRRLEEVEIEQRIPHYLAANPACSCAISSVTNAGYQGIAAQIASLIKTALCLYYRYIPPVPRWHQQRPKSNHPFYVVAFAKPWFLEAGVNQRVAAINVVSKNAHIILAEEVDSQRRSHAYLEQMPCYLFPLAANAPQALLEQLDTFKQTIKAGNLAQIAKQTLSNYQHNKADYALAIVGKNKPEILKECDRAVQGIAKAFETGKDWQTPIGSYFTAHPQGQRGKIAYVYPGAYNAHVGLGKDLFHLFPNLIDEPVIQSTCNRIAGIEKLLYPRSWHKLTPRELEAKEKELMNDPLAMLESETGFAGLMSTILQDYFQVKPQAAFGYSLGETSMIYAQGVWGDIDRSSDVLNTSPLFKNRLVGTKEAVREYWQLPNESPEELWRTYVVMANSELVKEKLQGESRVYLTQISTPKEVVIAGDPQGCERVIASLDCDAFRAPFNHVIHCEAIKSEYDELVKLNTLPLSRTPKITFYSAAHDQKIKPSSQEIAHSLAQALIHQLDFPRLVERVYQDNYRIFIEVGAGSNCSRWIKDILQSQEHAVISLHRRGSNDFTSLIKAIAKLLSHRVQLDLSPFYGVIEDSIQDRPVISSAENKVPDPWQESTPEKVDRQKIKNKISAQKSQSSSFTERSLSNMPNSKTILKNELNNLILSQPSFLKFNQESLHNNSHLSKTHSIFIEQNQECLLNFQEVISIHSKALQKIVNEASNQE